MQIFSKNYIGFDIGSSSIKVFQLRETKRGYELENFAVKELIPDSIVDGSIMDAPSVVEIIKEVTSELKIKNAYASTSIAGHSVIVKKINMQEMSKEEMREAIYMEAEQYIPFAVDDVNIDFQILGPVESDETQIEVLLVAAKKEQVDEYSNLISEAGLIPVVVDIDVFAIENCYEANYGRDTENNIALVNIGASTININILKRGTSAFVRDISIGGRQYTEAIQKELQIGFDDAEKLKKGQEVEGHTPEEISHLLDSVSEEICQEVSRSFDFFKNTETEEDINKVVLSGGCAGIPDIDKFISAKVGTEVEIINPFKAVNVKKGLDLDLLGQISPYASVGVGLAIRRMGD